MSEHIAGHRGRPQWHSQSVEGADGRCRVSVDRQADVVVLLRLPQRPKLELRKCLYGAVETDSVALNVPVSNQCGWSLDCSMDLPWNPLTCSLIAPPRGEASKNGDRLLLHATEDQVSPQC